MSQPISNNFSIKTTCNNIINRLNNLTPAEKTALIAFAMFLIVATSSLLSGLSMHGNISPDYLALFLPMMAAGVIGFTVATNKKQPAVAVSTNQITPNQVPLLKQQEVYYSDDSSDYESDDDTLELPTTSFHDIDLNSDEPFMYPLPHTGFGRDK